LTLSGQNGNDTFTLDESGGFINFAGGISLAGGVGNNSLYVIGTANFDTVSLATSQVQFNASAVSAQNIGAITYADSGGNDTINVNGTTPTTLNAGSGNDTITLNGSGAVVLNTAATGGGAETLVVGPQATEAALPAVQLNDNSGSVTVASGGGFTTTTGQHELNFSSINIASGATMTLASSSGTGTANLQALANHASRTVAVVTGAFSDAGTLDIVDNDLILRGGSASTVRGLLATGSANDPNTAIFKWNGTGMNSSAAAARSTTRNKSGIGYALNDGTNQNNATPLTTFDGVAVGTSDLLIKYTWAGDWNLDGKMNLDDYGAIDRNAPRNRAGLWAQGDFNYDGVVNLNDYSLIDPNINRTMPYQL